MLRPVATLELVYVDERGSTSATIVNIPASSTVETGDANAMALASLIAPMTDCVLIKYRLSWRNIIEEPGIAESGAALVNAGAFLLSCDPPAPDAVLIIPAIKDDTLLTSGVFAGYGIDRSDSRVIAMLGELLAVGASNPFGDAITAIAAAYRQSRR